MGAGPSRDGFRFRPRVASPFPRVEELRSKVTEDFGVFDVLMGDADNVPLDGLLLVGCVVESGLGLDIGFTGGGASSTKS